MRDPNQPNEEGLRDTGPPADESGGEARLPDILSFVFDRPNIVTLLGLGSGFLAIYFALNENYPAAMIAMLWAVLADWYDGLVARSTSPPEQPKALRGTGYFHQAAKEADPLPDDVCMTVLLIQKGAPDTGPTTIDLGDLPIEFSVSGA